MSWKNPNDKIALMKELKADLFLGVLLQFPTHISSSTLFFKKINQ
jgi:hypothetical protein